VSDWPHITAERQRDEARREALEIHLREILGEPQYASIPEEQKTAALVKATKEVPESPNRDEVDLLRAELNGLARPIAVPE
jgi:hypothetical protein